MVSAYYNINCLSEDNNLYHLVKLIFKNINLMFIINLDLAKMSFILQYQ